MPRYEKKDWILLRAFINKGNSIDIIYDRDDGDVCVTLNENTKINIEDDVKSFISRIFREEKIFDKVAMDCLANHSYIVYKRKMDRDGTPVVIKCNPDTGYIIYSQWEPYLVFVSNTMFVFNDIDYIDDEKYVEYCRRIEEYCKNHTRKQRHPRSRNEYYDENDIVHGEQEDWGPDTFQAIKKEALRPPFRLYSNYQ